MRDDRLLQELIDALAEENVDTNSIVRTALLIIIRHDREPLIDYVANKYAADEISLERMMLIMKLIERVEQSNG